MDQKNLQNKIDNLDKEQQAKLAKYISKLENKKQLTKLIPKQLPKEEPKKNLEKKIITKIVSSMNKAYESFNVDIINDKVLQVQLHQSKELTKDFLIGELNKNYGIKINIRLNITFMKQIEFK